VFILHSHFNFVKNEDPIVSLKSAKSVARIAHNLACPRDVSKMFGKLRIPSLFLMLFSCVVTDIPPR
jgi:hypothetical protein